MTEIILRKRGASLVPVDDQGRELLAKLKDNRDVGVTIVQHRIAAPSSAVLCDPASSSACMPLMARVTPVRAHRYRDAEGRHQARHRLRADIRRPGNRPTGRGAEIDLVGRHGSNKVQ